MQLFFFFGFLTPTVVSAQAEDAFDEISITINVQRIGSIELPAIMHGETPYLPIKELFDFLKIKMMPSPSLDSISGFFITPQAAFLFDKTNNRITYQGKTFELDAEDMMLTETNLYLKSNYFGSIFGLQCNFNFRSLSISLMSKSELPAIREMQQELMRKNIIKLKGEKKADTTIARSYSLFHLGMADWSVVSRSETQSLRSTKVSLGLGANIAGGEASVYLNYNSEQDLAHTPQYYRWRYVNNNNSLLRQITAGKVFSQSTVPIYAPIIGIQLTNTPTTYRRSFGSHTLTNKTEPGWMVELYVNNILVNYMQADASGLYSFEVPMVYGNSIVKLRFFGPWGEEQTREQNISVPFNFLPLHQSEYTITAGIIDDKDKGFFSRTAFNYGFNRRLTIGSGMEYLSTLSNRKSLPFANASVRLASNLLITAEHTVGVRTKGVIGFRLPSNLQIDLDYTKYVGGQDIINFNYLDEKKAVVSMPIRRKKYSAFSRLTLSQVTMTKTKFTSAEALLSTIVKGVNTNFTTNAVFTDPKHPFITSSLSVTFRLPAGIRITPQTRYEYNQNNFNILKCEVEKTVFRNGFFSMSYENNSLTRTSYTSAGLRYNFSFAQTSFAARKSKDRLTTIQSAHGSMIYNDQTNNLLIKNQSNMGKGGIVILPYLDINCNGIREANEPKVANLNLHVNGGRIEHNKDTTINIVSLEAYTNYFVELDKNSFENLSWQIKKKTISVAIDPNRFKLVEVAVSVMGEVSGTVYLSNSRGKNGLSRIIVNVFDTFGKEVGHTLSEADGYFSFLGLPPGRYTARIDEEQLKRLSMTTSSANEKTFTIKANKEGDVIDGLEFVLRDEDMYVIK